MANMHDTYEFLKLLAVNNNREWFNANKAEYQELRKAWENDISRLLSLMGEYDESLRGLQVKDCAYRIYRDVRFSADKSPYKTYFSAVLGKKGRKCIQAACYLHMAPGESGLHAGIWWPENEILSRLRSEIDANADEKLSSLAEQIVKLNAEDEMRAQEIKEFLNNKDNRYELETLTPSILQADGETKFRKYFELLYPRFLPRLREKVPSVTHREEILSMLIVLKQDNKKIADLMAIAPRSVLMLRHRFRQKIGISPENSLQDFINEILNS